MAWSITGPGAGDEGTRPPTARRVQRPFQRDQMVMELAEIIRALSPVLCPPFGRVARGSQRVEFAPQLDGANGQSSPFCSEVFKSFAPVHQGMGGVAGFYTFLGAVGAPQI